MSKNKIRTNMIPNPCRYIDLTFPIEKPRHVGSIQDILQDIGVSTIKNVLETTKDEYTWNVYAQRLLASNLDFCVTPIAIRSKTEEGNEMSILQTGIFHAQQNQTMSLLRSSPAQDHKLRFGKN